MMYFGIYMEIAFWKTTSPENTCKKYSISILFNFWQHQKWVFRFLVRCHLWLPVCETLNNLHSILWVSSGPWLPLRKHFPCKLKKVYHYGIGNILINSKASFICNNTERHLISDRLENFNWMKDLFDKWSTLAPKRFYAIPFQKLVFLVSLYLEFLE